MRLLDNYPHLNRLYFRVNPVTGHIPTPRSNPLENMTEEQKEYLAMQLANQVTKLST